MTDIPAGGTRGPRKRMIPSGLFEIVKMAIPKREAPELLPSEFHRRLIDWINDYNSTLDNAHEVGIRLVSFGQTVVFHLEDIGYWNPSLISFSGKTDDGHPVQLIQHVSQISVLLTRLPRQNSSTPKLPIGFHAGLNEDAL